MDRAGATSPALGKQQVRQAMNYAIDRDSIAKAVGPAFTPSAQIVPKDGDGYDASLNSAYPYDPAKAKQLLASAGYPNGVSFKLVDVSLNSADTITQAAVQELGAVGIKADLTGDATDLNKFIADMASKKYGVATFGTGGPMFANALQNFASAASPLNPFNSKDPQITQAFNALATASEADQKAAAVALNKAVSEQAWFVPIAEASNWTFAKGVNNLGTMGPEGELNVLGWS
jgi:peptide/nickel transport system substrate-binding protein